MTRLPFALSALLWLVTATGAPAPALAQPGPDEARPAFSLSSGEVFTTRDRPAFYLTFRRVTSLDFRVYRVRDPFAFFQSLRDPHQLGSDAPQVPQERSVIERIAEWKAGQRRTIRAFLRNQVSRTYRVARRERQEAQQVSQRVTLQVNTFAQVPLLNPDQLVTSWRELLPDYRDAEMRRIPLDVTGPGVYVVEAVSGLLKAYTVVIISDMGVVMKVAPGQVLMFAADRFTGEPQADCETRLLSSQQILMEGRTSVEGLYEAALPEDVRGTVLGLARCGDQIAATDPGAWYFEQPVRQLVAFIYTDKPIYRPGHTVHLKGVLRWRERDAVQAFDRPEAEIVVSDPNDKVLLRRQVRVDEFGAVSASVPVPASAALGHYAVRINAGDEQATGAFEVQEYRKPEYDVRLAPDARFVRQGGEAVAAVEARYYFGQPVANARVRWVVNQQPYYSPFRWSDGFDGGERTFWYSGDQRLEGTLRLDADGRGEIRVPLAVDAQGRDYSVRIEAQVTDASNREVSGQTVVNATFGDFLIAADLDRYVFRAGGQARVFVRALDYAGEPRAAVPLRFVVEHITYPNGYYADPQATPAGEASATTDAAGQADAAILVPAQPGTYRVTAIARAGDRDVTAQAWLWVPGATTPADEGDRYLELLADKRTYAPGETARLMVRGETITGAVLVTKEGQHVSWYRLMRPGAADAIAVPIDAGDVGDIYVHVTYLRDGRLHQAERRLAVPPVERTLSIALTADQAVSRPQQPGTFRVRVTDAAGDPVRAQVSLAVIDEAVYGVKADETPDPVRVFHRREYSRVGTSFSRYYYFIGYSGREELQLARRGRRPFSLADFKGDPPAQPQVRQDFPDAIHWVADLVTDAAGEGRISVRYPDALTTWRLTARAVTADTRAGTGVTRTTTTKDLIVRVVTPRFLTEGDEAVLPTIVHNYLPEAQATTVTLAADGLGGLDAASPAQGVVAPGAERRDDWRVSASSAGEATVTATARTAPGADALRLSFPVLPYGLRRESGFGGSIVGAGEETRTIDVPAASNEAARRLRVSLAPSMAGSLLGALDFLTSYPYGCTEQTLSSFLPHVLVTRTLTDLKLLPTERLGALDRQVSEGLQRLYDYQQPAGGWGWWRTDATHPFMTAYAIHGLLEAQRAGYRIEEWRVQNGARALAVLHAEYPRMVPDLKAYTAWVMGRALGDESTLEWWAEGRGGTYDHGAALDELWNARERMSAYGRALLLLALDAAGDSRGDALARSLADEAETRGDLSWWPVDRDPLLFDIVDTSVEATAFAVQALVARDPGNALMERAVRWLLLNRRGGAWGSTKQTAMAIYGLLDYMRARGEYPSPFSVELHVNGAPAGARAFTAASLTAADPVQITVPARAGANEVRIVKRGGGALYWSATAEYYDIAGATSRTGSRQLAVTRRYARLVPVRIDDRIVYREEPFTGTANPGDVLSVRLVVAGARDWRYLVLEDPLPAGVEALQDDTAYPLETPGARWWGSRVEYRDQQTVFFQEDFGEGRYEYQYLVRVISSGRFRARPAQISPMYVPDVTASSEPLTLTVAASSEGGRR
jgi:alpha-2-macroglobulin